MNKNNLSKESVQKLCYAVVLLCFYFTYIYCAGILKSEFSFSSTQIIQQNFMVALVGALNCIIFAFLSFKIHPLKLLMFKLSCFLPFVLLCAYLLGHINSPFELFLIQLVSIIFALGYDPAASVLLIHFPVFRRFTYASFLYALSRALMYVVTSFGMVYLTEYLGHQGLWIMMFPVVIGYIWSVRHFMSLEKLKKPVVHLNIGREELFAA